MTRLSLLEAVAEAARRLRSDGSDKAWKQFFDALARLDAFDKEHAEHG